ncbi:MAG: hypothetical protein D6795_19050 [Deltaproteobacteria bacterium]|nr:MAG: hypothetical protein D6795_19050 [Deltaproteobacteria bacterium]
MSRETTRNGRGKVAAEIEVELLSRPGCTLCREAKEVLTRVRRRYPFTMIERNIDEDPDLLRRYGEEIPVVLIEGRKAFKFRVSETALRRRLEAVIRFGERNGRNHRNGKELKAMKRFPPALQWTLIVLGLVLIVLIARFTPKEPGLDSGTYPKVGYKAPEFRFPDLSGKIVRLSDFRGSVVVLNFFATWCPPCKQEMPSLQKLHDTLDGEHFKLIVVSEDNDKGALERYLAQNGFRMNVLLDQTGLAHTLYQITGYPETFILDASGTIVEKYIGPRDWAAPEVLERLRQWIAKASGDESG